MIKTIENKIYGHLEKNRAGIRLILGIVLFLYAAYFNGRGIDSSDTTYALGNYQHMDELDPMWIIATYMSNIIGRLLLSLPGTGTLYGVTIYANCIFALFVEAVYIVLSRLIKPGLVFAAELIAVGVYWCPKVIFYNSITYYLMTLAIFLLVYGLKENSSKFLIVSGTILGFNVFVRFSNALESLLILGVWFYEIVEHHNIFEIAKKTVLCMAGYLFGFAVPLVLVVKKYDIDTYFDMIKSLFEMTHTARDYGDGVFRAMIYQIVDTFGNLRYLILLAILFAISFSIIFKLFGDKTKNAKILAAFVKISNVIALVFICFYFFKKGIYTISYYEYSSIFRSVNMFIVLAFACNVLNVIGIISNSSIFRSMSFISLVQMLIAPIGTNNHMYAVMSNLFITAPLTFAILHCIYEKLRNKRYRFAITSVCIYIAWITILQSFIFHLKFSYMDGNNGGRLDTKVTNISRLDGLYTTKDKAYNLEGLYAYIGDNDMTGYKAMFFGQDTAGLAYIMDIEPATNTLWPDLDSYTVSKYDQALSELKSQDEYLIIISSRLTYGSNVNTKKQMLEEFIIENGCYKAYENEMYTLYSNIERSTF